MLKLAGSDTKRPVGPSSLVHDIRESPPMMEVQGGPGHLSREAFGELWLFREVLWAFILRHIKVKYKQAGMGVGWAVLQPLLAACLFALFVGRLAHIPSEGVAYLLFALAGMVAWSYFSTAVGSAMESLVTDQALLRKVYFPREILPVAAAAAALVDLGVGLTTLAVVGLFYGVPPAASWLLIPLPVLLLVVFAAAVGIGLSAINVYYRDVRYALPFLLQLGLFVSPVVFPLGLIPQGWRGIYAIVNPVAAAIEGLRQIFLHHALPDIGVTIGALVWATGALLLTYALFKRLERGFSDRV
jgi:ABC-type polysaccharide/polyol phosphate export permease